MDSVRISGSVVVVGDPGAQSVNTGKGLADQDADASASNFKYLDESAQGSVHYLPSATLRKIVYNSGTVMQYPAELRSAIITLCKSFLVDARPWNLPPLLQARIAGVNAESLLEIMKKVKGVAYEPQADSQSTRDAERFMTAVENRKLGSENVEVFRETKEAGVEHTARIVQMVYDLLGVRLVDNLDGIPLQKHEDPAEALQKFQDVLRDGGTELPLIPCYDVTGARLLLHQDLIEGFVNNDQQTIKQVSELCHANSLP